MNEPFQITVRGQSNTYNARLAGKSASNTAGPMQAAQALLRKVLGAEAERYTCSKAQATGQDPKTGGWVYVVQVTPPAAEG